MESDDSARADRSTIRFRGLGRIYGKTRPGDSTDSLAERVLKGEHEFLVEILKRIIEGDIAM
jgi:hypothetical protein